MNGSAPDDRFPFSRRHQLRGFEPQSLIGSHKGPHHALEFCKRTGMSAGRRRQFSGEHLGPDECDARALTGHGRGAIGGAPMGSPTIVQVFRAGTPFQLILTFPSKPIASRMCDGRSRRDFLRVGRHRP